MTISRAGACVVAGALVAAPALAITPISSPAILTAIRTGEIIGAAEACGLPEGELIELGRKVIGRFRETARDAAELQRAQTLHEQAVGRGAQRIATGRETCARAVEAFRALERER